MPRIHLAAAAMALLCGADALAAEPPKVVASIPPVHSLVAGVMQGAGAPRLLLAGAASAHTYALKPSDARALQDADLVFWVGEGMEAFLAKPLAALGRKSRAVPLWQAEGMRPLETRTAGSWARRDDHRHARGAVEHDMHVWLDPDNAKAMVLAIASELARADPERAPLYGANAERLGVRIEDLDRELGERLKPVANVPYVVFHDAYQYLEKRYGLNAVGAIAVSPERRPGAKHVAELRSKIKRLNAACVFSEPQFDSALVARFVEGTGARTGVLDPEGWLDLRAGPDLYFDLMRNLSISLSSCLSGKTP